MVKKIKHKLIEFVFDYNDKNQYVSFNKNK